MMIIYVLALIVFVWAFKKHGHTYDKIDNTTINKGYGHISDDISTLLTRIQWVNKNRNNYWYEYLASSIIIVLILTLLLYNDFCKSITRFVQSIIVCFIMLLSLREYFMHHGGKFKNYYINKNIKLLRKKLGLKKVGVLHNNFEKYPIKNELQITEYNY